MTAEARLRGSYAVILAGGSGTRLWPLSRRARPKPFLPLLGEESPFQRTLARIEPLIDRSAIYVVAEERLLPLAAEQAPWLSVQQLLSEPIGRNTAAAVALAALAIDRPHTDVMLVLPADANIVDENGFRRALATAASVAESGSLVVIGVTPTGPQTGYGYIVGSGDGGPGHVARFVEKPDRVRAQALLAAPEGAWWNAGVFVWRRDAVLAGLERHAPTISGPLRAALVDGKPLPGAYADLPQMSIDHALLEPASLEGNVKVVPAEFGWSDVGSWSALHAELARLQPAQATGVVGIGRTEDVGSEDVLVHSSTGRLVVTVGLRGTIVVDTPDVLLVCDGQRAQDVRSIVDRLVQAKETEYL